MAKSEFKQAVYSIKEKKLSTSQSLTHPVGRLTALVTVDLSEKPCTYKQQVELRQG